MSEETAVETPPAEAPAAEAPAGDEPKIPKIKDGEKGHSMEGLSEFARQRLEKDLKELERMIKDHFETRKKDEADLASLQDRIEKRQVYREEQNKIRSEREKARQEAAIEAKKKQEELEERRKKEEEEAKKNALAAMSMNFSGGAAKRERKAGAGNKGKELKKKVLAERRKALNVDHLTGEKLQEKAVELHKWLVSLEESRYDLNISFSSLKDDLKQMRTRVNDLMGKKKTTKVNVRK